MVILLRYMVSLQNTDHFKGILIRSVKKKEIKHHNHMYIYILFWDRFLPRKLWKEIIHITRLLLGETYICNTSANVKTLYTSNSSQVTYSKFDRVYLSLPDSAQVSHEMNVFIKTCFAPLIYVWIFTRCVILSLICKALWVSQSVLYIPCYYFVSLHRLNAVNAI